MSNAERAFPEVQVKCRDRMRTFCLNLEALCLLEAHMADETGNPDYKIGEDFDWEGVEGSIRKTTTILWAGFHEDARGDSEPWTLESARSVLDLVGMNQAGAIIMESLQRAMPNAPVVEKKRKKATARKKTTKRKQTARKASTG